MKVPTHSLETALSLYCGIDLHSNNHFSCVIDEKDNRIFEIKLDNDAEQTIKVLSKYKRRLKGIAVESTYNWYWLVDALMEAGHHVDLVNTAKVVQYRPFIELLKWSKENLGSGISRSNNPYKAIRKFVYDLERPDPIDPSRTLSNPEKLNSDCKDYRQ